MAKTKLCKYCKSQIDKKASICPHCQKKQSGIGDAFKCVIAAIALIIFVPLFVSACNGVKKGYKDAEKKASVEVVTTAEKKVSVQTGTTEADATTVTETESATTTEAETTAELPKSENVVVYEQNGIKITYTGVEDRSLGYLFKFLIENDSDIDINVMDEDLSVNSFMMSAGGMYTSVASHKKANDAIYVYKSSLEENSISNIEDIEFFIRIYDSNNLASHFDSDVIRINVE